MDLLFYSIPIHFLIDRWQVFTFLTMQLYFTFQHEQASDERETILML